MPFVNNNQPVYCRRFCKKGPLAFDIKGYQYFAPRSKDHFESSSEEEPFVHYWNIDGPTLIINHRKSFEKVLKKLQYNLYLEIIPNLSHSAFTFFFFNKLSRDFFIYTYPRKSKEGKEDRRRRKGRRFKLVPFSWWWWRLIYLFCKQVQKRYGSSA